MIRLLKIAFLIIFLHVSFISFAQVVQPAHPDTVREFEIIRAPSMRSIFVDSTTTLQTLAGGAIVKQGTTTINGDSIVVNPTTHVAEAFGNVHINQADSVQTYSQYLKYTGTDKTAYLKKDVRLNDNKSTLFTQELDYNLNTGIGNYQNGGKVINGKTIITSTDGTYYADTKDIYFKNNVEVIEPKNHVTTDSLLYNIRTQHSTYTGNTHIKNKEADIYTTQGNYDVASGSALFTTRTRIIDSSGRVYIANNIALDDKTGNAQLEGNAIVKDSAGGFIVFANQIFANKKSNSFLATRKPVLIIKQKDDSIYVAADTIFSGYSTMIKKEDILKKDSIIQDSSQLNLKTDTLTVTDSANHRLRLKEMANKDSAETISHNTDSLELKKRDTANKQNIKIEKSPPILLKDSIEENIKTEKLPVPLKDSLSHGEDSLRLKKAREGKIKKPDEVIQITDTTKKGMQPVFADTTKNISMPKQFDSLNSIKFAGIDTTNKSDSAVRYFLAFHHVRIFNDSLQSVCDSLFFSAKDSVFRLYYDPVIWSGHSQITGDTIYLYTKNKKADRLYAFERGMIVNKTTEGFFNQIAGKTINGYFTDGKINYMRVRGSQAESVYYAQDDDSAYVGMNRATGDVIDLYFKNDELKKVLFVNDIKGKMYPMKQIPEDQKFLKNFIWITDKRPKNKLELFE
jgi:lipopolysaccharide export system protein LptA